MAFHTIRAKILWVRIFVTACAFSEIEIYVPGFDCIFRPSFRVTLVAFYFRVLSGQRVICQSMVEGIGLQTNDIHIRTLVIGMTVLAVSLKLAVIALLIRESLFHGFMTVQAEQIVYPSRQRMARIAILQFFLSRVRPCEFSGREELG
jgi:hypothetical protein